VVARVHSRLTVLRHGTNVWQVAGAETTASVDRLQQWLRSGAIASHLFRYDEARLLTHRLETIGRPLKLGLLLRALSRGRCYVEDQQGRQRTLSVGTLARWTGHVVREPLLKSKFLAAIERDVAALEKHFAPGRSSLAIDLSATPVYLRTDISSGPKAGGSVAHIAGVLNNLDAFTGAPILLTTDVIPTVRPDVEAHYLTPLEAFWEYRELPSLVMNRAFEEATSELASRRIGFVYQRYSVNSIAGARLAADRHVPFVVEYNGSEIWISRHWGERLQYERLSERIELLNLAASDLIVVVSRAIADDLTARGIARGKILVNPNGVDVDRYTPRIDGADIRRRLGLTGKTVVGFIGTFGAWHGAEVLADAFARLMAVHPAYRERVRLLMIGDGVRMRDVVRILDEGGVRDACVLTGLVPQEEGPQHLAACDILVSPHVPNPDGTPFFGSPTKLFEYMAMGKPIVASDLDQIGEVLEHDRTAHLVTPGDPGALAEGIKALLDDPARCERLATAARRAAVDRHSWREHTRRIIERLCEIIPASPRSAAGTARRIAQP
jgi:glycosyltransferase involved in cell wall biosynthesis